MTPQPDGHVKAFITYDPDMLELGRVAALRIRSGRGAHHDYATLAEAYEELTRQLQPSEENKPR